MRNYISAFLLITAASHVAHANTTTASYYADKFNGRKTANGEIFSNQGMTCASNNYALGTKVEVTNIKTGQSIICKVNDRIGKSGRIDLSKKAFSQLAPLRQGLAKVSVRPITHENQDNSIRLAYND
ncbi:septal ring lytic transglycosylase RlpA family protein [Moraxella sp. Tifton1]|uniref:Septal ring lytic transglycosylase RlpA family protein n=1 Tax=Moraxella oculi TaxID=2940516 RepID=A0ABW8U3T5_9GAMM|nr:septal ring lytic transglycosylase RlpA family protein [Moraxella sp. Tifton1]MCL1622747.1 septal ring lytic transglycosylase RlpA family protein [Moraxella sp. Tifton1]